MSKPLAIGSAAQFTSLLSSSTIVVTDFHAQWCGPCHQIAPIYEQLAARLSRPNKITFTKVDVDELKDVAQAYQITAMPTFMIFKNGQVVSRILGADPKKLSEAVQKLAAEAGDGGSASGGFGDGSSGGSGSGGGAWLGASLPKGYSNVTGEVDGKGLDLLNADSAFGSARVLFDESKPSGLDNGKGKGKEKASSEEAQPDWIESDTDEQVMLFMPFQSSLKIHSLHITSLPPKSGGADGSGGGGQDEPLRPKELKLYTNKAHVLGFEEADDVPATQEITLAPADWDEKTGTAKVELRFVKFQNVASLVLFVVSGDGDGERVRMDRIRIVGEAGKKREMGKLEKIGDEPGE